MSDRQLLQYTKPTRSDPQSELVRVQPGQMLTVLTLHTDACVIFILAGRPRTMA